MSRCVKELGDYDLVEKRSKHGIALLRSIFHQNKNMSDGLYKQCKRCRKQFYNETLVRTKKPCVNIRDRIKNFILNL